MRARRDRARSEKRPSPRRRGWEPVFGKIERKNKKLEPDGGDHPESSGSSGFTLIEVLVAFIIMTAMATMLYRGLSGGLRVASVADGEETALLVAKAHLAAAGVETPLQAGEQEGRDGDVSWHVTLRPYQGQEEPSLVSEFQLPSMQSQRRQPDRPLQAYWATVTVSWRPPRGGRQRSIELTTIKLGRAP